MMSQWWVMMFHFHNGHVYGIMTPTIQLITLVMECTLRNGEIVLSRPVVTPSLWSFAIIAVLFQLLRWNTKSWKRPHELCRNYWGESSLHYETGLHHWFSTIKLRPLRWFYLSGRLLSLVNFSLSAGPSASTSSPTRIRSWNAGKVWKAPILKVMELGRDIQSEAGLKNLAFKSMRCIAKVR